MALVFALAIWVSPVMSASIRMQRLATAMDAHWHRAGANATLDSVVLPATSV